MHPSATLPLLLLFMCFIPAFNVRVLAAASNSTRENPFSPAGYLIRYWKNHISNDLAKPEFLLNKASQLSASRYAAFSKLAADPNSLSAQLHDFCAQANLFCFPELSSSLEKHIDNVKFNSYIDDKNFTNYGTNHLGGEDAFTTYSDGENVVVDTFRRYSRDSISHQDNFTAYASDANVVDQSFNTYGTSTTGGKGHFSNYNDQVNVPNLRFSSYSDESNGRAQTFSEYTNEANSGDQGFTSYGKNANGTNNEFISYGKESNVIGSTFTNLGENGKDANDTFTSYGTDTNNPKNNFRNYGTHSNTSEETFTNYREQANVGDDTFQSYAKNSNTATVKFVNYGHSINDGTDKFSSYGKNSTYTTIGFKTYGANNTFADYKKQTTTFASYRNKTTASASRGKKVNNKWVVQPGKFFREAMLRKGSIMTMPDIRDKMPRRSFLPRVIVSKLPFSTSKITEIKKIFHAGEDGSSMAKILADALIECERSPSQGETKRCVSSVEDMIDFATSVLGRNVAVRTTENTHGYNSTIMLGEVKGIQGGKVTKSVSCHQSLYPYLLYYCHSVPKVRLYEADILDPKSKSKINHGVAICHLDTSTWSAGHGAFILLGSGPGKIEVCHWIYENDMTWAIVD
ncbi:fungal class II heme-containing peroxidase [Orobanche gracilis]